MNYEVVDKIFVNEAGNQINYKRLSIQGYLNGTLETIELPISKEQAVIYKAMSSSKPEISMRSGGTVDTTRKSAETSNESESWLD